MIDFYSLNKILNSYVRKLLPFILPSGRFEGKEYVALNPRRCDRNLGSFRFNSTSLLWCDFATGDKGKGLVSLYAYVKNIKFINAARELADYLNIRPCDLQLKTRHKSYNSYGKSGKLYSLNEYSNTNADFEIRKSVLAIWNEAVDPRNTVVEKYLRHRGIVEEIPLTIRYLPNHLHRPTGTNWPCMLAAVSKWPERKIIAIHRTYLEHDGSRKAPIEIPKMLLGKSAGGAIRLSPIKEELILAEGIETALSLSFLLRKRLCSIWAVLSAGGYINLALPALPFAREIIIAADNDPAGLKAGKIAAEKWSSEGRKVKIAFPPQTNDFNDVLREEIWE